MSLQGVMKRMGGPAPVWSPGWEPQQQHVVEVIEEDDYVTVKYERDRDNEEQATDVVTETPLQTIDYEAVASKLERDRKQRQRIVGATKAVEAALKPVAAEMDKLEDKLSRLTG